MKLVIILSAVLIALIINGCCETEYVNIPVKCKIPSIGNVEDTLDHNEYNTTNGIITRMLHNSDKKSEYILKLIEAQKVCE